MEVTNSEQNKENTLKEPKKKIKVVSQVHHLTVGNFQIEKNIPKKKIVRISKKKREKNRLLKIKKNRPIHSWSHNESCSGSWSKQPLKSLLMISSSPCR